MGFIIVAVLIVAAVAIVGWNIKIVPQSQAYVIERLGTYSTTWGTGVHILIPFLERIVKKLSLKEQLADFPPQPVITKDNVTMKIDTVIYYQITDPKLYTYGVESPVSAMENLTATTLRNIIGELELDNTLTSRDIINTKMRAIVDETTDPWGIKVNRVEVKNILPPVEIQNSMEKQMKAEREKRARITEAEADKRSKVLIAEGEKEAAILRADAARETRIREAQGEAEAIITVQKANSDALKLLNSSKPTKEVITLKSFETFQAVANGNATKIIIPSEIQNMAGLITSIKEVATDVKPTKSSQTANATTTQKPVEKVLKQTSLLDKGSTD